MSSVSKIKDILSHGGFKRYFANTGWLVIGRGIALILSFFVATYVARYLGPTNYGTLSYAIGFVGLFSFLANLGIDQIIYRELIKDPEKKNILLGSSLGLKLGAGTLAFALASITSFFIDKSAFVTSLILIISLSFLFQPFHIVNFYFQSQVKAKKITIVQLIVAFILAITKVILALYGFGIYYFSAIFAFEALLYAIFYISLYQKSGNALAWRFDKKTAWFLLGESWPYMIATALAVIYTRIDQVMIKHIIDATSVGIYDAAVRVAEIWYFVPGAIITSMFPAIVNARKAADGSYERRLRHFFVIIAIIAAAFALPIHLLSKWIINTLYGIGYSGADGILSIYVWGGIGFSLSMAITQYLSAEHRKVAIFASSLIGMIINITLNIIWIPTYGMQGAAWATLVAYSLLPFTILVFGPIRKHIALICKS